MLQFQYDIFENPNYGAEQKNGTWNGIVGDVLEGVS